jgi:hypothetical protein
LTIRVSFELEAGTAWYDHVAQVQGATPVTGLGDRAVSSGEWAAMTDVAAVKGGRTLAVRLTLPGPAAERGEKAVAIAKKIIGKI